MKVAAILSAIVATGCHFSPAQVENADNSAWTDCDEVPLARPPCGEQGLEWDSAAAEFKRTCEAGVACGCMQLGTMIGCKPSDRALATTYFQRACDLGVGMACGNLGVIVFTGQGLPADKARGIALWQKACDGDFPFSCISLAKQYAAGTVVTKDLTRARTLMQRACDLGQPEACSHDLLKEASTAVPPSDVNQGP